MCAPAGLFVAGSKKQICSGQMLIGEAGSSVGVAHSDVLEGLSGEGLKL